VNSEKPSYEAGLGPVSAQGTTRLGALGVTSHINSSSSVYSGSSACCWDIGKAIWAYGGCAQCADGAEAALPQ
jgi:hypothetical protein